MFIIFSQSLCIKSMFKRCYLYGFWKLILLHVSIGLLWKHLLYLWDLFILVLFLIKIYVFRLFKSTLALIIHAWMELLVKITAIPTFASVQLSILEPIVKHVKISNSIVKKIAKLNEKILLLIQTLTFVQTIHVWMEEHVKSLEMEIHISALVHLDIQEQIVPHVTTSYQEIYNTYYLKGLFFKLIHALIIHAWTEVHVNQVVIHMSVFVHYTIQEPLVLHVILCVLMTIYKKYIFLKFLF